MPKPPSQAQVAAQVNEDPRVAELHQQRKAQANHAKRMLRDFDPER
jgi:hypothetical protein